MIRNLSMNEQNVDRSPSLVLVPVKKKKKKITKNTQKEMNMSAYGIHRSRKPQS